MHRLKALGLCIVAVFAMTRSRRRGRRGAAEYKTESSDNVFTITHSPDNLSLKLTKTTLSGKVVGSSVKTATVHPEYSGCEVNEIPVKVETKSCNYRLNQPTLIGTWSWTITVPVLTCPSTAPITVKFSGCTIEISETGNSALSHSILGWAGTLAGRHITAAITLGGITAKQSAGCPGAVRGPSPQRPTPAV